ncbi:MAG: hypothetical protein K2Z25_12515 [Beijerinckiaceae bacterium]|nr:hypothetical protein [Beijerinckiaceae bacterium]
MKTAITIDELQQMANANVVSLPHEEDEFVRPADGSNSSWVAEARARSARIAELMQTVRELTRQRSMYDTVDLERWLDERED